MGHSVAGDFRIPPIQGHKKHRAPTPLFRSTAWCEQNKVSELWLQLDTPLSLRISSEGDFPGSFPKRWYLICLLHQRFLSDGLPVRCGRPRQWFPYSQGWNDSLRKYHTMVIFQHFSVKYCFSLNDGTALKSNSKIVTLPHPSLGFRFSLAHLIHCCWCLEQQCSP